MASVRFGFKKDLVIAVSMAKAYMDRVLLIARKACDDELTKEIERVRDEVIGLVNKVMTAKAVRK